MTIVISNEIIQATGKNEQLLRLELAIIMFRDYHISSAKAADFANLSLIEFRQEIAKRNISDRGTRHLKALSTKVFRLLSYK